MAASTHNLNEPAAADAAGQVRTFRGRRFGRLPYSALDPVDRARLERAAGRLGLAARGPLPRHEAVPPSPGAGC